MTRILPAAAVTSALVLAAGVALVGPAVAAPASHAQHEPTASSAPSERAERSDATDRVRRTTGPLVIAHRGASGYRPEHTLAPTSWPSRSARTTSSPTSS